MGVTKEITSEGSGPKPHTGQLVDVHCTGYLDTHPPKKFWSTHDSGKPFSFNAGVGKVIRGWDEGILTMKVGESARFKLSADYAYGAYGFPSWGIPPNQPLIFDIELLKVDEETQM